MTDQLMDMYGPFDGTPQYENFWREMMKHVNGTASGVIRGNGNDFSTTGDSTGMQVKVAAGEAWVRGHYAKSTGIKTLAVANNATGLTRIDRAVLRADFTANTIVAGVVTGTASAPALTQNTSMWETSLALVSVANGAVTITAGNVTDDRSYTTVFAKYTRNTNQTIADSTNVDVVYNNAATKCADVTMNGAGDRFTLNRSGLWQINAQQGFSFPVTGAPYGRTVQILDGVTSAMLSESTPAAPENAFNAYVQAQAQDLFPLGQTVKVRAVQRSGTSLSLLADTVKVSFMWVGP